MFNLKPYYDRLKKNFLSYSSRDNLKKVISLKKLNIIQKPNILVAGMFAHNPGLKVETYLALELIKRGSNVSILGCDSALDACLNCELRYFNNKKDFIENGPKKRLCGQCSNATKYQIETSKLKPYWISKIIDKNSLKDVENILKNNTYVELKKYTENGINIGEHSISGTLRFLAKGNIDPESINDLKIFKKYFKATYIFYRGFKKLLERTKFDSIVFHHGIYTSHGIMGDLARAKNIKVVNWNLAYRSQSLIFSHHDTYHHTLMSESTSLWENISLSKEQKLKIKKYLKSRQHGNQDWIYFHGKPKFKSPLLNDLQRSSKKKILLLTNVFWDAQLHYPKNIFEDMLEWLLETVEFFLKNEKYELIVRVHPAELRGTVPSNQKMVDEINKKFKKLPKNINIIGPDNPISTYSLFKLTDLAVIYGTKTGVELTAEGIPTIVAGEAWIKNKGLTYDPTDKKEYFNLLSNIENIKPMTESQTERALLYAFHFFFRRMIPVNFIKHDKYRKFKLEIPLKEISENNDHDKGLDIICNGIINGEEFIYPAEEI